MISCGPIGRPTSATGKFTGLSTKLTEANAALVEACDAHLHACAAGHSKLCKHKLAHDNIK